MRYIDADAVHAKLPYPTLIDALCDHHTRDVDDRGAVKMDNPGPDGETTCFLSLPAWRYGEAAACKLVTVFPQNEKNGSGLPSVHAVVVVFDGMDGTPRLVIDGTALTLRKTAADSGMGTKLLANPEPERLLMVGAGAMAPHLIQAHIAARPSLRDVRIWNRTPARAQKLAANLDLPGVSIEATEDLEGTARTADVISCATMTVEPLIRGDWLKPGAHLDLVGSFRPDMRECDEAALTRASVFVDSRWSAIEECGELLQALRDGVLQEDDIRADAFQLVRGERPGRMSEEEITLFKNGGGGHLDLMVAQYLMDLD
jgi:ornithine cyclodeaminase